MDVIDVIGIVAIPTVILGTWIHIISVNLNYLESIIIDSGKQYILPNPIVDSRTGALLHQMKGEKTMLTASEAFLVREAVREKIETLLEIVRHESAKPPTKQDLHALKHFQAELERYEIAYQKMLNEVGC
ncbi:hypothetical protein [Enterococcus sp. DIV1420a]|uniref:hypothetical protein n=1 Tax=Enterococcus sp. DIV1420a TaxID=2774672 RepID=UPI003F1FEDC6